MWFSNTATITETFCLNECAKLKDCNSVTIKAGSPNVCQLYKWYNSDPVNEIGSKTYVKCSAYVPPETPLATPILCTETNNGGAFKYAAPPAPAGGWCNDPAVKAAIEYNNVARARPDGVPANYAAKGYQLCNPALASNAGKNCVWPQPKSGPLVCDEQASAQAAWWSKQMC
jgi:hypothetical protein